MSKSKKIIILEDDHILLKALNIELISNGFEVLSATDGVAGIKIIEKEKPDLVLLDLVMPKMHGFEVLKKLKNNKNTKNIPVIILSNLGQEEEVKKGMELGAFDYYKKASTDLNELSDKIKKSLF